MSTQPEHKQVAEAQAVPVGEAIPEGEVVPEGDLKGSDFFPPGSGWNEAPKEDEAPREIRDLDLEQREREAGETVKPD